MRWLALMVLVAGCGIQSWHAVEPSKIHASSEDTAFVITPGDAMEIRVSGVDVHSIRGQVVRRWTFPSSARRGSFELDHDPERSATALGWRAEPITAVNADIALQNVQLASQRSTSHALASAGLVAGTIVVLGFFVLTAALSGGHYE